MEVQVLRCNRDCSYEGVEETDNINMYQPQMESNYVGVIQQNEQVMYDEEPMQHSAHADFTACAVTSPEPQQFGNNSVGPFGQESAAHDWSNQLARIDLNSRMSANSSLDFEQVPPDLDTLEKCEAQSKQLYEMVYQNWQTIQDAERKPDQMTYAAQQCVQLGFEAERVMQQFSQRAQDKLRLWSVEQRKLSAAPQCMQRAHRQTLVDMNVIFETCGCHLADWHHLFGYMYNELNSASGNWGDLLVAETTSMLDILTSFRTQIDVFMKRSFIFSKQPPECIVKARGAANPRSKTILEIMLLGGVKLGFREHLEHGSIVKCSLNERQDIYRDGNGFPHVRAPDELSGSRCQLKFDTERFKEDEADKFIVAQFSKLRVVEIIDEDKVQEKPEAKDNKHSRRREVYNIFYHFVAHVKINGGPESCGKFDLDTTLISLPLNALVRPIIEAETSSFWERAFTQSAWAADPMSLHKPSVDYDNFVEAFRLKFTQLCESDSAAGNDRAPYFLPDESINLLWRKLGLKEIDYISREEFMQKTGKQIAQSFDASTQLFTDKHYEFHEYVWKFAELVRKFMQEEWSRGLIYGFADGEMGKKLLRSLGPVEQNRTLLIRFSERKHGYVKLQMCVNGIWQSYERDLDAWLNLKINETLGTVVQKNHGQLMPNVKYVYPRHPVERLWDWVPPDRNKDLKPPQNAVRREDDYPGAETLPVPML